MKFFARIKQDLPASIVVFFVAIPLCLGIAQASNAPFLGGLIAGAVGGIVVGLVSGSALGVSGPAAGLVTIMVVAHGDLGGAAGGGYEALLVAVVLAGVFQLVLGLVGAGMLGYFFPSAVIKGMLAAIGISIALHQLSHALGYDEDYEGDLDYYLRNGETVLSALGDAWANIEPAAVTLAVLSLVLLVVWEQVLKHRAKVFSVIPGPLAAVVFGISFQAVCEQFFPGFALSRAHLVDVPVIQDLAHLRAELASPDWSRISEVKVLVTSVTIALVASLETLLCVAATDKLDPRKRTTPTDRELVAQGVGNMTSGLLGGLPVTQVIVRSSANIQSGGETKAAAVLHGVWITVFVLLLPGVLNEIPLATLAAILIVVGYKLARPALWMQMWRLGKEQFFPFAVTVVSIVFTDLLTGIGIGLGVALLVILRRNYINSHFLHIVESEDNGGVHHVRMNLSEEVTFLNKGAIIKELTAIPDGSQVTIDGRGCQVIDQDIVEVIQEFRATAADRGLDVRLLRDGDGDPGEPMQPV